MRKKITVLITVLLLAAIAVGGTAAYYTTDNVVHNVITTAGVTVEISEKTDAGSDFEDLVDVMPSQSASKIVMIKNTGENDAYIRMKAEVVFELAEGKSGETDPSLITIDYNTTDWTLKDGYWYYNTALKAGETTKPLFTTVKFAENMPNLYQESKVKVIVGVYAVQTEHNGETVFEAAGWPEDN